ncbi:MAG: hypothetical protein KC584_03720, partial [Nitrospira sp.]|nr:hypothetical protein [Nitrospira sp.]
PLNQECIRPESVSHYTDNNLALEFNPFEPNPIRYSCSSLSRDRQTECKKFYIEIKSIDRLGR